MPLNDHLTQPVDIDALLLSKRLEPLALEHIVALEKIQSADVRDYTEAEVRAYVIDPIIRILGYDKGTIFSADLEHPLKFLNKNRFPDYQFSLWNENFWLIEAKKPGLGSAEFGYDDLSQAIEYSIHPKVNAALVVLCDGIKLEIFDREVSVEEPLLRVRIADLVRDFDKIRAVLEPIQVWFFQKRRIVRLVDKVFDKEFNMQRLEEFSRLLEGRLLSKQQVVIENFRRNVKSDSPEQRERASAATVEDITELYLFDEFPIPITNAVNLRLVALSQPSSFHVMLRIFPDYPRDANDVYMAQAITYLMALGEKRSTVEWLPAWLAQGAQGNANLESATQFLFKQCLTYFQDYEPYRLILLASCAFRRIAKFMAISNDTVRKLGEDLHALARHQLPEIAWDQIVASPEGQLIGLINGQTRHALAHFVKQHVGTNGKFLAESAKLKLKGFWQLEEKLLASVNNYAALSQERTLGEMRRTECSSVTFDNLGHMTLCLLHRFPSWKTYALDNYRPLVEALASMNSFAAKEMLGVSKLDPYGSTSDSYLADRFFLGNAATLQTLRSGYRGLV